MELVTAPVLPAAGSCVAGRRSGCEGIPSLIVFSLGVGGWVGGWVGLVGGWVGLVGGTFPINPPGRSIWGALIQFFSSKGDQQRMNRSF